MPITPEMTGIAIISATSRYRVARLGHWPRSHRPGGFPNSAWSKMCLISSGLITPSVAVTTIASPTSATLLLYGPNVATTRRTVRLRIGRRSSSGSRGIQRPCPRIIRPGYARPPGTRSARCYLLGDAEAGVLLRRVDRVAVVRIEDVSARPALDEIVRLPVERRDAQLTAGATNHRVGPTLADQVVVGALPAPDNVAARAAISEVAIVPTVDLVVCQAAEQEVVAGSAEDEVLPSAADHGVSPASCADDIVALRSPDRLTLVRADYLAGDRRVRSDRRERERGQQRDERRCDLPPCGAHLLPFLLRTLRTLGGPRRRRKRTSTSLPPWTSTPPSRSSLGSWSRRCSGTRSAGRGSSGARRPASGPSPSSHWERPRSPASASPGSRDRRIASSKGAWPASVSWAPV